MNTVAVIEAANGQLTPQVIERWAAWLDDNRQMICASGDVFSLHDNEAQAS
ncbi:MAG: hypothetical protein IT580_07300 [Verrucomicrobiales bacterium]|nr:hypothetical protein [Verrucomicrobiales bacterium]